MFEDPRHQFRRPRHDALSDLRQFVEQHSAGLYDAAALLAGRRGISIVDRIVDGLAESDGPSRRTIAALHDLRDVLSLEHVDNFDRPEAPYFATIDPNEPVVEDICLLCDQFSEALEKADLDHLPASLTRSAA
jgi:hypothetical protein